MSTLIKRTQAEIVDRIRNAEIAKRDTFGVERGHYLSALTHENAAQFLARVPGQDPGAEKWNAEMLRTDADVRARITEYLGHAWDKANACRVLSAVRSLSHLGALLWLMSHPEADDVLTCIDEWSHYGKPQLVQVSEIVGFEWKKHDDGKWRAHSGAEPQTAEEVLGR